MADAQRPRCFLDVNIGEQPAGRLVIELFADKCPRTAENFRQLCTGEHSGLSYAKAPFHRVIDEFMIQGGDIVNGDGTGTASIYGGEFEDENLQWRQMDAAGLVCSANRGKDTNGSQYAAIDADDGKAGFFITLEPCPHLNGKHTIFGRLVSGEGTLEKIAKVDVDDADRPLDPVLIARCGELERKKKKVGPLAESVASESSADRGRRRRSNDSDHEMADTPEPPPRRNRRQSDNQIDEGLRGRPRKRSKSGSSAALSTASEEGSDEASSPVKMHKRKRSPSPSRHQKRDSEDSSEYERRRRSLPNQYNGDRHRRNYGEESRYRPSPRHHDSDYPARRRDDRYRPSRGPSRYEDDSGRLGGGGRLGGENHGDQYDAPVKFKGRGVMKYREPGRL